MGIDSLNKYYSVKLKRDRGKVLDQINGNYESVIGDLSEIITLKKIKKFKPDLIVNLAAQAGVNIPLSVLKIYIQ